MTRSVKDLRELICVSRLSIRDSDEDDDYDLSRPLSSLSIYGERPVGLVNGNGDYLQRTDVRRGQGAKEGGFAVPRPPVSGKGASRLHISGERPRSAQNQSLSEHSSFNFGRDSPLPPVKGGSRPGSDSSSGSDRPGSGEAIRSNFDHVLQHLTDAAVTEWLERTTQMLNELTTWCNDLDHFVEFAQFWMTEFPENQRLEIYKLEISIVADELIAAFGDAYVQGKVQSSDISGIVSAVLKEYPNKLCSAQGGHVFLDILDTVTSQKTQAYRRLLTDTGISTRNSTYAQSLLALRAFALLSIWSSVVHFYRRVTAQAMGAEGGEVIPEKKSSGNSELIAQQRLFRAVQKGFVSVIYYYLRNERVKLDVRDDHGRTLTFAAVLANQSSVLHYLISKVNVQPLCPLYIHLNKALQTSDKYSSLLFIQ